MSKGATPTGSGLSPTVEPASSLDGFATSIPSADIMAMFLEVFDAGVRRGVDEATAFDWGCRPTGKQYDNLVEVLLDWANKGLDWRNGEMVLWETLQAHVAQAIEARRAETAKLAPSSGESAVAESDAPEGQPS